MEKIQGNMLRGHVETMVLAVLSNGDAHGFEIMQRLDQESRGILHLKEGTLYPTLYRLEKSGAVKAHWDDGDGSKGPRRRIYRLTQKGKRELAKRRDEWQTFVSVIGSIVEA